MKMPREKWSQEMTTEAYLTGELPHVTVDCHVVLQELDLGEPVTTDIANVLLLVLSVVSLHM